jgi:hypothetical protein
VLSAQQCQGRQNQEISNAGAGRKNKQTNKQTDHYSLKREKEVKNVEVSDAGYFLESNDQEEKENRMIARRQRLLWFG